MSNELELHPSRILRPRAQANGQLRVATAMLPAYLSRRYIALPSSLELRWHEWQAGGEGGHPASRSVAPGPSKISGDDKALPPSASYPSSPASASRGILQQRMVGGWMARRKGGGSGGPARGQGQHAGGGGGGAQDEQALCQRGKCARSFNAYADG